MRSEQLSQLMCFVASFSGIGDDTSIYFVRQSLKFVRNDIFSFDVDAAKMFDFEIELWSTLTGRNPLAGYSLSSLTVEHNSLVYFLVTPINRTNEHKFVIYDPSSGIIHQSVRTSLKFQPSPLGISIPGNKILVYGLGSQLRAKAAVVYDVERDKWNVVTSLMGFL